jgi:hypothetical protein
VLIAQNTLIRELSACTCTQRFQDEVPPLSLLPTHGMRARFAALRSTTSLPPSIILMY